MSDRLGLTWPTKDKSVVTLPDGGYKWVERNDPRTQEVRLLHEVSSFGEADQENREPAENLLITGDSADALRSLSRNPDLARAYRGKVKLIYIDPPFNTGQVFKHYPDAIEHSLWLTMMRDRFVLFRELLAANGTVWVHLDGNEVHRARCLLDEVFGSANYLTTVVWQRTSTKSLARRTLSTMHEYILVYGASNEAQLKPLYLPLDEAYVKARFTERDERGRYNPENLTAGYHRPHIESGKPWRGFDPSERGRCWAVPSSLLAEIGNPSADAAKLGMHAKLDLLDEAGYIHWPDKIDGFPRYKKYLHNMRGRAVGDLWTDINVINSQAQERTEFSTQKPEGLIERILQLGTNEGDLVLDCFAGSGTTVAAAHKMRRRWVAVELNATTVDEIITWRLQRIIKGEDNGGITKSSGWTKGGQFKSLVVAPSNIELLDGVGRIFLAEHSTGEVFFEAVRVQLGFEREIGTSFQGRRGRMRLLVVDGVADVEVVHSAVARLEEGERVTIVAKSTTPDAYTELADVSSGSRLRKAPHDLFSSKGLRY